MVSKPELDKIIARRSRRDLQNLINAVLESPLKRGEVEEVDGARSLKSYETCNTTVMTRIVIQMALDAMKGDDKKAKLLFDYAGLMPVKEQSMSLELPQFVNDMGSDEEDEIPADIVGQPKPGTKDEPETED